MTLGGDEIFRADATTLFVLGNGPSLARINLHDLSRYPTLGMNAAYRHWQTIDWRPQYYACLDTVVGLSHRDAIASLIKETGERAIRRFILRDNLVKALGPIAFGERVVNFDALRLYEPMLRLEPVTTGSHAALWAATAGFDKIVLLGVDGAYVERVKGARNVNGIEMEIVDDGDNPNYFFGGYQRKGDRYNLPNPRPGLHVGAWEAAADALRRRTVNVVNGNSKSSVRFFPFVDPVALIANGEAFQDPSGVEQPGVAASDSIANFGGRRSIEGFIRGQRTPLAIGLAGLLICAAVFATIDLGGAGVVAWTLLGLYAGLFVMLLYVRAAASLHIARLDAKIAMLETAAADRHRACAAPADAARERR